MGVIEAMSSVITEVEIELSVQVKVEWHMDENPDLSYLGEYSMVAEQGAIDRDLRGNMVYGDYRYWNPGPNHVPHNSKSWAHVSTPEITKALLRIPDDWKESVGKDMTTTEMLNAYQVEQDYIRHESFMNREWHMMGCVATAKHKGLEAIGSIYGIESFSSAEELKAHEEEMIGCAIGDLTVKIEARLSVE